MYVYIFGEVFELKSIAKNLAASLGIVTALATPFVLAAVAIAALW